MFKITNKPTKQTTKQPGRPIDQTISRRPLSVVARFQFLSIFFHCPGDGDCMYFRPQSTDSRDPPQEQK
jgi:hypothetical protein